MALSIWERYLGGEHRTSAERISHALIAEGGDRTIPSGWLPTNVDDPLLLGFFKRYWQK